MILFNSLLLLLLLLSIAAPCQAARISLSTPSPKQGQTVEVTVIPESEDDAALSGEAQESEAAEGRAAKAPLLKFNKEDYVLFPSMGSLKTLIAIPADLKPGKYEMSTGKDAIVVSVLPRKFPVQHISLPKTKDNFIMSPGEEQAVDNAKKTLSPVRHWNKAFVRPSAARTSSGFGLRRVVNGRLLKDYYHSGLDFAGGLGSPVVATANAKVILARTGWRLQGNTVALDHGQGVVSFYIHLSKVLVKEGQMVTAGQKIGLIGGTGRASGPHLHFSIYVNNHSTDPLQWFASAF